MRTLFPLIFCCFLFPTATAFSQEAPMPAPGSWTTTRGSYGDWQMRCESTPGTKNEQCALVQTVMAQDRANVGLMVIAGKFGPKKMEILRVIAPLGVFLPFGLGLRIDEQSLVATDFVRCVPNGCMAEAKLTDDLMSKLRNGKNANFVIFQTPEEGIGIPVSLNGFAQGYEQLK